MRQPFLMLGCSMSPENPLTDFSSSLWIHIEQGSLLNVLQKSEDNDYGIKSLNFSKLKVTNAFNYCSWEFIRSPTPIQITSPNTFSYILRHDPRFITILVLEQGRQTIAYFFNSP